jgi:hypothetical protein
MYQQHALKLFVIAILIIVILVRFTPIGICHRRHLIY